MDKPIKGFEGMGSKMDTMRREREASNKKFFILSIAGAAAGFVFIVAVFAVAIRWIMS